MTQWKMWINGTFCEATHGKRMDVWDPATEDVIGSIPLGNATDVDKAVEAATEALHGAWGQWKPKERGRILVRTALAIEANLAELALLESRDSGKPLPLARKEIMSTARYFEYYGGAADKIQGDTIPLGPDYIDFTLREPMGVTAHVIPWNMPLNMVGRSVAPALATGNTAIIKPSEFTSLTSLKLAEIFAELGLPAGVYNVVTGTGPEAGEPLCTHPRIDAITFTGSVPTGRKIMRMAAEHIKPVVLELGGKSPLMVFEDADLDLAAAEAVKAIYANSGQICSAGSRLLVDARIQESLVNRIVEKAGSLKVGPGVESPDMGPVVSKVHHQRVMDYIRSGKEEGARLRTGGSNPLEKGYFIEPTVFDRVQPQMRIAQEEIFGPVLSVITFEEEAEALAIANDVPYGLVAGMFTNDINRAMRLAKSLRAGQIYVNEYFAGGEETPFGGQKQSGFGREKGLEALAFYTQVKNVAIRIR